MIISIDIGTSYSSMSILGPDGRAKMVDIGTGVSMFGSETSLPSAVFAEKSGSLVLGQAAMNRRKADASRFRMEFKRNLGETVPILLGEASYLPQQLYTVFFRYMKEKAGALGAGDIEKAYLTFPASYSNHKKNLLQQAAAEAGLFNTVLVEEPVSAAMSYCAQGYVQEGQTILTYDFGGGTFDAAILGYENGSFRLLAEPAGIENCGGIDMDREIFRDIMSKLDPDSLQMAQQKPAYWSSFMAQLSEMAVKAKHHLSSGDVFEDLISLGMDQVTYTLTRDQFQQMAAPLVSNTIKICRSMLEGASMKVSDLSAIVLAGGTSRVPLVRTMVEQLAAGVPVYCSPDPDLAVAQGALNYGSMVKSSAAASGINKPKTDDKTKKDTAADIPKPKTPKLTEVLQNAEKVLTGKLSKLTGLEMDVLIQGVNQDSMPAAVILGRLYENGCCVKKDPEKAFSLYLKAGQQKDPQAMKHLARCYENGIGTNRDPVQAEKWNEEVKGLENASPANRTRKKGGQTKNPEAGSSESPEELYRLGEKALHSKQPQNGLDLLKRAAEQNHVQACLLLGKCLEVGDYGKPDPKGALVYYRKAADTNDLEGMKALARFYEHGIVYAQNIHMARTWYQKAADLGDQDAAYWINLEDDREKNQEAEKKRKQEKPERLTAFEKKALIREMIEDIFDQELFAEREFSTSIREGMRTAMKVPSSDKIILSYDSSLLGNGKVGFVLTSEGMYGRSIMCSPIFTSWEKFAEIQLSDSKKEIAPERSFDTLVECGAYGRKLTPGFKELQKRLKAYIAERQGIF